MDGQSKAHPTGALDDDLVSQLGRTAGATTKGFCWALVFPSSSSSSSSSSPSCSDRLRLRSTEIQRSRDRVRDSPEVVKT